MTALIVIDMQKRFYRGFGKTAMDAAQATLNRLVARFRDRGAPIVWVQHESRAMGLVRDTEPFELIEALSPAADEKRIVKRRGNSFAGTDLEAYLRGRGVDRLVLGGYAAEACVHKTFVGGKRLGFATDKIRGGISSGASWLLWLFSRIGSFRGEEEIAAWLS
jgi:nicotinamidase-related amidase